jgi:hypothetical protein
MDLDIFSFIDCFSRMTWFYLMKNKNNVLVCFFKDFYKIIQTQYNTIVKVLRSDNRIKYTNRVFMEYL